MNQVIRTYGREALDAWKAEFAGSLELQSAHQDALAFVSHQTIHGAPPPGFEIDGNGSVRRSATPASRQVDDLADATADRPDDRAARWADEWERRADLQVMFISAETYVAFKRDETRNAARQQPSEAATVKAADWRREFEGSAALKAEFLSVDHYLALRRHEARRAGQRVIADGSAAPLPVDSA